MATFYKPVAHPVYTVGQVLLTIELASVPVDTLLANTGTDEVLAKVSSFQWLYSSNPNDHCSIYSHTQLISYLKGTYRIIYVPRK